MRNLKISTKIKAMGALLVLTMFTVIFVTINLNQQNVKDALIVNIAGKQRMLTQRITKNIFYLYQTKSSDFAELDKAVAEFIYGINTLKDGNKLLGISAAPTKSISEQISKVLVLWNTFNGNVGDFKASLLNNNPQMLGSSLTYISNSNNELLKEVDDIVTLYTNHIEEKTTFIKKFQYTAFALLCVLTIYSLIQLKQIEAHAREFIEKSKRIGSLDINQIELMDVDAESEILEVADNLNCFINKVNSAMSYSQTALEESKKASNKLEEITGEFGDIMNELEDKSTVISQLDKSEDMVIESTEDLLKSTKRLQNLKNELDKLLVSCKSQ